MCGLAACKLSNFPATKTSTPPQIGIDFMTTAFDNRKQLSISFWNVRSIVDNCIEGSQNARFLQRYKLDVLGLR